jgi:hypothetical protein
MDPEVRACIDAHLPEDGYGFESDGVICTSPPPGQPQPPCEGPTPEEIAQECAADGHPCDASAIFTHDAALCIAGVHGLDEGIGDWEASLVYNYEHHAPIWAVLNLTHEDPDNCSEGGDVMFIHAETGEFLDFSHWESIC